VSVMPRNPSLRTPVGECAKTGVRTSAVEPVAPKYSVRRKIIEVVLQWGQAPPPC
jgi:hypothetical protein